MLGKPFFKLCQSLQDSRTFSDVADLLSNQVPALIGADDVFLMVYRAESGVDKIFGHGRVSERMRERMEDLNRLGETHPLVGQVDFSDPGNLGFAVSDYVSPEVYRESEFNQVVKGPELASEDSLFGLLGYNVNHHTMLVACRSKGAFTSSQRQVFDALLFIARAVLERIGTGNVETQVTNFLLTARADHPNAFFVVNGEGEALPVNRDAVVYSETHWGEDEALKALPAEKFEKIKEVLDESWLDPVVSTFKGVEVDLGDGEKKAFVMYKQNGAIVMVMPITGEEEAAAERVAAVLTRRQREIMDWIAEGKTSAEVAIILEISPRTVEKHLEAVFQRLGVENRIAAVRRYLDLRAGMPV